MQPSVSVKLGGGVCVVYVTGWCASGWVKHAFITERLVHFEPSTSTPADDNEDYDEDDDDDDVTLYLHIYEKCPLLRADLINSW